MWGFAPRDLRAPCDFRWWFWRAEADFAAVQSVDSARLGRGGGRSGHWSCAHWLRAMAGIDAGEGAAAAPPPELSPQQRIEQVRRVLLAGQSVYP